MLFGSAVETSDHRVSLRRSSQGKSNSVASICVVSSIDTRSTKLKVSLRGSASSTLAARSRIRTANSSRCVGVNIGDTVLRWALCRGWSIAMKLGLVVARRHVADRNAAEARLGREDAVIGVDMHDVVVSGHRPIGLDRRVGAIMHRLFLAQPFEPGPQRVVLEQTRRAGMKILQRRRIGLLARGALDRSALSALNVVWMFIVDRSRIDDRRTFLKRRSAPAGFRTP